MRLYKKSTTPEEADQQAKTRLEDHERSYRHPSSQAHEANPTGGLVVDTEARATIVSLLTKLETLGLLKTS